MLMIVIVLSIVLYIGNLKSKSKKIDVTKMNVLRLTRSEINFVNMTRTIHHEKRRGGSNGHKKCLLLNT